MPTHRPKDELAREAWASILDFITATVAQRTQVLADLGLSVSDTRGLNSLQTDAGRTMSSLAREWTCDASTATWMVDRLERKGLAERRRHPTDRRAILVFLTDAGAARREELHRRVHVPPPELLEMTEEELRALRDAASRLPNASR